MDYTLILNDILLHLDNITFYCKFLLILMIFKTIGSLYRGR